MLTDPIDFGDLSLIEIPVTIAGTKYVLREADGAAACAWRNALLKATKLGPDGRPTSIEGLADTEPLLVSLCLFKITPNQSLPVTLDEVRGWPARIIKTLFNRAKEISQLDEGVETKESLVEQMDKLREKLAQYDSPNGDSAKNLPSGSTVGSGLRRYSDLTRSS